jgi:putative MATE family efflux protein
VTEPTAQTIRAGGAAGGWWATVREAIRGSRHDYTAGSLGQAIVLLAIPMVMEMIMESVFAVADAFWVAHLGANALATVGLTESWLTLIYTAAMGLSIGVTAMVARRIGERKPEAAADAATQGIALGLIAAAVIGVAGVSLAPRLLALMGATPAVQAMGTTYARVMLGGNATILLLFLVNAIFRGAGDAAIAMRVLWLANGINIVLGPCLIFGVGPFPRLGVTGAAIATNIGRGTGVLYQLYRLWRGDGRVVIRPSCGSDPR